MNLTYSMQGDYLLPNLLPPQEPEVVLGKYALLRRSFLMQHKPVKFTMLLTTGTLNSHLMEIEEVALRRVESTISQMAESMGVTEALKETDFMQWVGLMNNIKHTAEEAVMRELIYA